MAVSWLLSNLGIVVAAISALIAGTSAFFAIKTYSKNANTKRAEFLLQLHKAFFVDATYRPFRELIDEPNAQQQEELRLKLVEQPPEMTDFLNFFELIAYFERCGILLRADVEALLGYYLDVMAHTKELAAYITRDETSFEYLSDLLKSHI